MVRPPWWLCSKINSASATALPEEIDRIENDVINEEFVCL